jgi:acetoin utilization deacetylase AcuC-like enzyme
MPPRPFYLSHPSSLAHDTGEHPERAQRIVAIEAELASRDWLGYERLTSSPVDREALLRVHTEAHIELIEQGAAGGGGLGAAETADGAAIAGPRRLFIDADTVLSPGSHTAALHAAGGAVELATRLHAGGGGAVGVSVHRPPGHHATGERPMGFCLFNNVAVAAQHALDVLALERVMVLDWDVHHGNGTSHIFWASDRVLLVSIHQMPLYPGSGAAGELGAGAGRGYTVNLPVPPGSGDHAFVSLVRDVAVPLARRYEPQLILVSAGFDAHVDDPLAGCTVTEAGFRAMTAAARDLARELGVGLGLVLEGGYDVDALARSLAASMAALAGAEAVPDLPAHPLAAAALTRLESVWPGL